MHLVVLLILTTSLVQGWVSPLPAGETASRWYRARPRVVPRHFTTTTTTSTQLYASNTTAIYATNTLPRDSSKIDLSTSPPPMWGQPLSNATKEWNEQTVHTLKSILFDQLYRGDALERNYARFYALETIARMPYFSYLSVLHLFETLGLWRRANYLKVHFAESWNELHHLLICEELGGNDRWIDRFVAQHIAFGYYWLVVGLYIFNPIHAYHLNQMVEEEAYETYDKFITQHREYLAQQPAPVQAVEYYTGPDIYMFDAMHHDTTAEPRRPPCETLLDCFTNIRDDELEHAKTMAHYQKGSD